MISTPDIRWKQRFSNFSKARLQFLVALEAHQKEPHNLLYRMALIQGFEFTYELAWKTLKDYLAYAGVSTTVPRDVIKKSFSFEIISDGDAWINMIDDRNLMSHAYDEKRALLAISRIIDRYVDAINQVHTFLNEKLDD